MSNDDIDNLLEKWYNAKLQISQLENKLNSFKVYAEKYMDKNNVDVIKNSIYSLDRRHINKTTISKKDLPPDIWDTYSKENFYSSFYINKISERRKRSRSKRVSKKPS